MDRFLLIVVLSIVGNNCHTLPTKPVQTLDPKDNFIRLILLKCNKQSTVRPSTNKCPENQRLYPTNQKNEWLCDCLPGFIYHPPKDGCFSAYRQGPCPEGYHLILKNKATECDVNPCRDGYAKYKGECYEFGKSCRSIEAGPSALTIDEITLAIECLEVHDKILEHIAYVPSNCAAGSKRDINDKCRKSWNV